jgi:hypothetical protein
VDGRVKQLQGFGPLPCFGSICFRGHLSDLPWPPGFVSEGPIFHLSWSVLSNS